MTTQSEAHVFPLDLDPKGNGNRWTGLLEVFQAFHRWQQGPADYLKQDFFHRPARGLCGLHRDYPPHRHILLQRALPACLPGWQQVLAAGFGSHESGEVPLKHQMVPSGPGIWDVALDGAHLGFEGPEGARLMARVELQHQEPEGTISCFTLIASTEQAPFLRDLLAKVETWMDAHPHLRGAKLTAAGDFFKLDRAYSWEDIVLDSPTRAAIEQQVVQFVARLLRYRAFGLPTKRGILLVGPPGTGKTLLGKVLCSTLPTTFLWVSPGEIQNPPALRRLFELARELQPTLLFLEDLDLYASRRGLGNDALLGELLNQLDGFPANTGVLTLATTNDLRAIEPALAERPSRFDHVIRMDPPKVPERQALLARFLRKVPHPPACLDEAAAATDGLTGAHLQEVVHLAIQRALDGQGVDEMTPPSVTADHLREAVRIVRQQRPGTAGFYA
jgi:hypothetical protein